MNTKTTPAGSTRPTIPVREVLPEPLAAKTLTLDKERHPKAGNRQIISAIENPTNATWTLKVGTYASESPKAKATKVATYIIQSDGSISALTGKRPQKSSLTGGPASKDIGEF